MTGVLGLYRFEGIVKRDGIVTYIMVSCQKKRKKHQKLKNSSFLYDEPKIAKHQHIMHCKEIRFMYSANHWKFANFSENTT